MQKKWFIPDPNTDWEGLEWTQCRRADLKRLARRLCDRANEGVTESDINSPGRSSFIDMCLSAMNYGGDGARIAVASTLGGDPIWVLSWSPAEEPETLKRLSEVAQSNPAMTFTLRWLGSDKELKRFLNMEE